MGKILSVYFTNEQARICEIQKKGQNIMVHKAFMVPLPSGMIEDGIILDVELAATTLYAALKNHNIKRGKVAFVIASRRIANKEITLPFIKNLKKIEEIVTANAGEYFPMNNLEDYLIKHTVLDTVEKEGEKFFSVLVMAFQKEMIEKYYELAAMMKMQVETVDYYGNSIYQLLRRQLHQGTMLALQMDKDITYVSIMKGKAQIFKRQVPYGSETLIKNLAYYKKIEEEEAEAILTDGRKMEILLEPQEYIDLVKDFSSSISRVVEFHTSRNPGTTIEGVKLLGTGVKFANFAEALGIELGIDVAEIKELNNIKLYNPKKTKLSYEELPEYLPNLGVMFDPLALKIEEEKKTSYALYIILIVFATLAVSGFAGFLIWQNQVLLEEKNKLSRQLEGYAGAEAAYNSYMKTQNDYQVVLDYYNSTKNPTEMLYQMILDLENVMPESVGITDISVKNGAVEMTGISDGKDAVAKFVIELKKLPYIMNVRVSDIMDTTNEMGTKTSNFNISWQLVFLPEETESENADIQTQGNVQPEDTQAQEGMQQTGTTEMQEGAGA